MAMKSRESARSDTSTPRHWQSSKSHLLMMPLRGSILPSAKTRLSRQVNCLGPARPRETIPNEQAYFHEIHIRTLSSDRNRQPGGLRRLENYRASGSHSRDGNSANADSHDHSSRACLLTASADGMPDLSRR